MAGQGITADVVEIDERLSCSYRHPPPLAARHTGCHYGCGPGSRQPCTNGAEVGR